MIPTPIASAALYYTIFNYTDVKSFFSKQIWICKEMMKDNLLEAISLDGLVLAPMEEPTKYHLGSLNLPLRTAADLMDDEEVKQWNNIPKWDAVPMVSPIPTLMESDTDDDDSSSAPSVVDVVECQDTVLEESKQQHTDVEAKPEEEDRFPVVPMDVSSDDDSAPSLPKVVAKVGPDRINPSRLSGSWKSVPSLTKRTRNLSKNVKALAKKEALAKLSIKEKRKNLHCMIDWRNDLDLFSPDDEDKSILFEIQAGIATINEHGQFQYTIKLKRDLQKRVEAALDAGL